jgi:hypothetical protein
MVAARATRQAEVGEAGMEDLAGSNEIVEAPHDLFKRRDAIGSVRPVEVDPVGLEPLETRLDRRDPPASA